MGAEKFEPFYGSYKVVMRPVFDFVVTPIQLQQIAQKVYSGGILHGTLIPRKGLTREEEKELLPELINISSDHPEFAVRADNFWHDYRKVIPFDGTELEVGFDEATKRPLALNDYILYKMALSDPDVASEEADLEQVELFPFCLIDRRKSERKEKEVAAGEREAILAFAKLVAQEDSTETLRAITTLSAATLNLTMEEIAKMEHKDLLFQVQNVMKASGKKFLNFVSNAKGTVVVAKIRTMVFNRLLDKIDNAIYLNGTNIGKDEVAAAKYFTTDDNGKQYFLELETRLAELNK